MKERNSLLPTNASDLERKLEKALNIDLKIDIAELWQPLNCHKNFLQALALQYGNPYFNSDWNETTKRKVLAGSFANFQIRGTRKALIDALAPFGKVLEIKEWFNEQNGVPGTFSVRFALSYQGMDENSYNEIIRLIDEVRPVSRHLSALNIILAIYGTINTACAVASSETITVYPKPCTNINNRITSFLCLGADCSPTTIDIYPSN